MEAAPQASRISSTSKEVVNMKERDFKSQKDEASNSNSSHKHLDLVNLSENDSIRKSKVRKLDFHGPIKVGSSSNEGRDKNKTKEKASESRKTYTCIFCKGEFSTPQALGGHKKAHKPERALKKQLNQTINDGVLEQHNFPHYALPSVLATPSYYYKPLGVRMESMIQKPTYPRTPYSFGYGHGLWQQMLNTSNVRLRNIEDTSDGATSRIEAGGGSGTNNNAISILKFGDSSTNAANKDEIHHSIIEVSSDSESSGLDLTLRL